MYFKWLIFLPCDGLAHIDSSARWLIRTADHWRSPSPLLSTSYMKVAMFTVTFVNLFAGLDGKFMLLDFEWAGPITK
jgi:hypothetical protein